MEPKITVVICTFERQQLLEKALRSLEEQEVNGFCFKTIVIDTNESPSTALGFPAVEMLHEPGSSLSDARNLALRHCQTPFIAFMDDDAIACRAWLYQLLRTFDDIGEDAACVGGPIDPIWPSEKPHWIPESMLGYLSIVDWGEHIACLDSRRWLGGTNIAYRTDRLIEIGGFRVDLGRRGHLLLSNEELETQDRLRTSGYKVIYTPFARVQHYVHAHRLDRNWFRKRVFWQAISFAIQHPTRLDRYRPKALGGSPEKVNEFLLDIDLDTNDPDEFKRQCRGIYDLAILLAQGLRVDRD